MPYIKNAKVLFADIFKTKSCARTMVIISQQTTSSETLCCVYKSHISETDKRVARYLLPEQKMHFPYPYTHSLVISSKYDRYLVYRRTNPGSCSGGREEKNTLVAILSSSQDLLS